VANLGVAHVIVRGKTYCGAVSLEAEAGIFCGKHIEGGGVSRLDGVAFLTRANADAVHYDSDNRALFSAENSVRHKKLPLGFKNIF
jgi:hypothetical protein